MKADAMIRTALSLTILLADFGCSSRYVTRENTRLAHSPQKVYAAVTSDRTVTTKALRFGREKQSYETILGIVRDEQPYTNKPNTGANPTLVFLTASCPSSAFDLRWVDDASLVVSIHGCSAEQLRKKAASVGGVAISYAAAE